MLHKWRCTYHAVAHRVVPRLCSSRSPQWPDEGGRVTGATRRRDSKTARRECQPTPTQQLCPLLTTWEDLTAKLGTKAFRLLTIIRATSMMRLSSIHPARRVDIVAPFALSPAAGPAHPIEAVHCRRHMGCCSAVLCSGRGAHGPRSIRSDRPSAWRFALAARRACYCVERGARAAPHRSRR